MEAEIVVREVEEVPTRSGNTRYVVRDGDGAEYTTFRTPIGREAQRIEGHRARITYHEEDRGGYHNVYLDEITAVSEPEEAPPANSSDKSPDEAGWDTAVEAATWLLGTEEPKKGVPPKRLYDKLRPFKDLVADDIRGAQSEEEDDRRRE